jgi:hypothetical protein
MWAVATRTGRLDGVAGEADVARRQVGAVVGDHAGGMAASAGSTDQVVMDVVVVEQMGRRGGVGPVLLGAGDAVVVAGQPVAVNLNVEAGGYCDASVPVPAGGTDAVAGKRGGRITASWLIS